MKRQKKLISMFAIALAIALLLPCLSIAGSIEPPSNAVDQSGNPVPTMKTLDELYDKPIWKMFDREFGEWPANHRFAVSDNGTPDTSDDVVLDKETGLVWERQPWASPSSLAMALTYCHEQGRQHRWGWRLPTFEEMASLVDWSQSRPALPSGHPFIDVQWGMIDDNSAAWYWTATPAVLSTGRDVHVVSFVYGSHSWSGADSQHYQWCVRGGKGDDASLLLWIK
jgi:hypothetical protein